MSIEKQRCLFELLKINKEMLKIVKHIDSRFICGLSIENNVKIINIIDSNFIKHLSINNVPSKLKFILKMPRVVKFIDTLFIARLSKCTVAF